MKRILMTTAIVAAMGSGAVAETAQQSAQATNGQSQVSAEAQTGAPGMSGSVFAKDVSAASVKGDIMASALIGKNIYIPKADASAKAGDPLANLDDVGQVGDVVLTGQGKVDAVLVDVGGFLGIGTHTVALDWSGLQWKMKPDAKTSSDSYIVVNATRKQLESAPAFKTSWLQKTAEATKGMADSAATTASNVAGSAKQAMSKAADRTRQAMSDATGKARKTLESMNRQSADVAGRTADQTAAPAASGSAQANAAADAAAPGSAMAKAQADGYTEAKAGAIASAKLSGATVYDAKGNDIGAVSKLIVDPSTKKVQGAVIEVGGFLGLGQKPVELSMDQMHVMTKKNGKDVRIYVSQTEKQLKQMPAYRSKG